MPKNRFQQTIDGVTFVYEYEPAQEMHYGASVETSVPPFPASVNVLKAESELGDDITEFLNRLDVWSKINNILLDLHDSDAEPA